MYLSHTCRFLSFLLFKFICQAAKEFAHSHQTLQLGNGEDAVSLNLPVGADVEQMKEFVQQMQDCVAMMERAKEQQ